MQKLNEVALRTLVKTFAGDRKGVTAVEYGIIAGLMAVAVAGAIAVLGPAVGSSLSGVATSL